MKRQPTLSERIAARYHVETMHHHIGEDYCLRCRHLAAEVRRFAASVNVDQVHVGDFDGGCWARAWNPDSA